MTKDEFVDQILISIESKFKDSVNIENFPIQDESISEIYSKSIKDYLLEPYENGFWELTAEWSHHSEFHQEILNQTKIIPGLDDIEKNKETLFKLISDNNIKNSTIKNKIRYMVKTLSFPLMIFNQIRNPTKKNELEKFGEFDLKSIESKFDEALEIFNKEIYFDKFTCQVKPQEPLKSKTSLCYVLEGPKDSKIISIASTSKEDIEKLAKFYSKLGIIKEISIKRVFSPDDRLFKPYFRMLSSVFHNVVTETSVSKRFREALNYYRDDDFQHCISTLGLIAESYLQQIYSTLIRDELPNGLTLGQTLDALHKKIEEIVNPNSNQSRSLENLSSMIKNIEDKKEIKDLKSILLEIHRLIEDDRKFFTKKINDRNNSNKTASPFPKKILINVNELLKWRNSAAHNSRIALGNHEADRTIFCLVRLINWWNVTSNGIDWNKNKADIISELVSNSK